MDWLANAGHLIIRLIIWCALPLGIWAGAFGIWLRKKYEGHLREDLIVTGGMLVLSTILVVLFCIGVYNAPTFLAIVILVTYAIMLPAGIYAIVKIYKTRKRLKELMKED